jgi:hypothetical protein
LSHFILSQINGLAEAYRLPSTIFAVLLAFAHVIAVSKTTTTAKYFTAGDFMVRILSQFGLSAYEEPGITVKGYERL